MFLLSYFVKPELTPLIGEELCLFHGPNKYAELLSLNCPTITQKVKLAKVIKITACRGINPYPYLLYSRFSRKGKTKIGLKPRRTLQWMHRNVLRLEINRKFKFDIHNLKRFCNVHFNLFRNFDKQLSRPYTIYLWSPHKIKVVMENFSTTRNVLKSTSVEINQIHSWGF